MKNKKVHLKNQPSESVTRIGGDLESCGAETESVGDRGLLRLAELSAPSDRERAAEADVAG